MESLEEGDKVLAKLPNSEDYQMGRIVGVNGEKYQVQFERGTSHTISKDDISRKSRSGGKLKNLEGTKSSMKARSPARKRSPARLSSSKRSPTRSPSRKSPLSSRKRMISMSQKSPISLQRRADDEKDSLSRMSEIEEIPLNSRVTRRSIRVLSNMKKNDVLLNRNLDRAVSLPVERKLMAYEYLPESKERGFSVQREPNILKLDYEAEVFPDSSTIIEKGKKDIELINKPQEWGGWLGALCLIFLLPVAVILPQIFCFNNKCLLTTFHFPQKLISYLNPRTALIYFVFLLLLSIIQFIPIGKLIDGQPNRTGRLQYRINGCFSAVFLLILFFILEYYQFKSSDYIIKSIFKFSIYGWLLGTTIAIYLYIKARKLPTSELNLYASTGNIIYDFWQGRELNPRFGKLDVKFFLTRYAMIVTLLIDAAVIYKSIQEADYLNFEGFNVIAISAAGLQAFYCLDALYFEFASLTTFKILYEGTGYYTCVGSLLYPFFVTIGPRYFLLHKIELSIYLLVTAYFGFFVGYTIYRHSNLQKNNFRVNPYSREFSKIETILTSKGKQLMLSGFWGQVRHPNYLGDIIMHWSIACIDINNDLLLYYPAFCTTIILMHRAIRDNSRSLNRYGIAWSRYCSAVKSMIFKYIY